MSSFSKAVHTVQEAIIPLPSAVGREACRMKTPSSWEQKQQEDGSWKRRRSIPPSSTTCTSESLFPNCTGFYAHNWAAGMLVDNQKNLPGLFIAQACTTSTTILNLAALAIEHGRLSKWASALMADRCSNGAHTVWPNPMGPGGEVIAENWLMDNFNSDPNVSPPLKMVQTAENVAKEAGITKEEVDAVVLRRYEQYLMALENDRAFQKRYMFPAEVKAGKKQTKLVELDEGVTPTTAEGLAKLRAGGAGRRPQLRSPDISCGRELRFHRHDPRQGKRDERKSRRRYPDRFLWFLAGQAAASWLQRLCRRQRWPLPTPA